MAMFQYYISDSPFSLWMFVVVSTILTMDLPGLFSRYEWVNKYSRRLLIILPLWCIRLYAATSKELTTIRRYNCSMFAMKTFDGLSMSTLKWTHHSLTCEASYLLGGIAWFNSWNQSGYVTFGPPTPREKKLAVDSFSWNAETPCGCWRSFLPLISVYDTWKEYLFLLS